MNMYRAYAQPSAPRVFTYIYTCKYSDMCLSGFQVEIMICSYLGAIVKHVDLSSLPFLIAFPL